MPRLSALIGALVLAAFPVTRPPEAVLGGIVWVAGHREADAVVWLDAPDAPLASSGRAVLDQRNLTFSPHVLAVRVGTQVAFPNNDRVFHNVFSFRDGRKFDLGLYPVGATRKVTFDRPGLSRIFCNIHSNMTAYVLAVDSSYYGVSDARGAFRIPPLPTGTYTYHAWRAGAARLTGSVAVGGDRPFEVRWP